MKIIDAPFTLVRPDHYVVVTTTSKGESVAFGRFLPLTKKAAGQFAKSHVKGDFRLIMRKTATRAGLI